MRLLRQLWTSTTALPRVQVLDGFEVFCYWFLMMASNAASFSSLGEEEKKSSSKLAMSD